VRHTGLVVPFHEMGAFNAFAWQFLWFAGLWIGDRRHAPGAQPLRISALRWVLAGSAALYGFWWRHHGINGQAPFGGDVELNLLFDKWQLGPLRIANLLVLGILAIPFRP